jgi:hypothetical protein
MERFGRGAALGGGLIALLVGAGRPHSFTRGGGDRATITGHVKVLGQVANPVIDMSEDPDCEAKYKTRPRAEIVTVNPNGTLANVLVYVRAGPPADTPYTAPTTPVVLNQAACMFHPHVLAVMVNQPLEIRNSDGLGHNVAGDYLFLGKLNRPFNISRPGAGMMVTRTFSAPEVVIPLQCNMHGWMHAYLGVFAHPFFAVTGADGSFTLSGLLPGIYIIDTWQEKYGTQEITVTVAAGETKVVDVSYAGG